MIRQIWISVCVFTLAAFIGWGQEAAKEKRIADVLPPKVRLTSPDKALTVREAALEVRARASSSGNHPVTSLHLHLDGRPLPTGHFRVEAPKLGDVEGKWTIPLTPGKHRLTVRAESAVSSALSEEISIEYVAAKSAQPVKPALYVLSIGISEYPANLKLDAPLRKYGSNDAAALARAFQNHSKGVFEKIEVKELTDKMATLREILKGIGWLKKQPRPQDVAVLFLAGQGELTSDGSLSFLPADVNPDDLEASGVVLSQVKDLLTAIPCRTIFMLDTSHAGGIDGKRRRAGTALTDDLIRDLVADEHGVIVLCASTGRQFALESDDQRHGLFTMALVEGLQGKAMKTEGAVYLHQLDAYVTSRVRELSKGRQSPTIARPGSVRSFPLSRP